MSAILEYLGCIALCVFALSLFDGALTQLTSASKALIGHHDERYLLYYCGAYLAAEANLADALAHLQERGAPPTIAAKAEAYQLRLDQRLTSIGEGKASCQQLVFAGYRLAVYQQNPDRPDHWPNRYFTLKPAASSDNPLPQEGVPHG